MKVKELIEHLRLADPELEVVVFMNEHCEGITVRDCDVGVNTVSVEGVVATCFCIDTP